MHVETNKFQLQVPHMKEIRAISSPTYGSRSLLLCTTLLTSRRPLSTSLPTLRDTMLDDPWMFLHVFQGYSLLWI